MKRLNSRFSCRFGVFWLLSLAFTQGGFAASESLDQSSVSVLKPPSEVLNNPLQSRLQGQKCQIWDDEQGISHIHSEDSLKSVACLGLLHGRDRAFQMDFFRKIAQGRRSEISGWSSIRSDFFLRLLGLSDRAKVLFSDLPQSRQDLLWAYSYGVNRGFQEAFKKGVYEFQSLGYLPEAWHPVDTLSLLLLQSFDQTRKNFTTQIDDFQLKKRWGEQTEDLFDPTGLPWDTTILKSEELNPKPQKEASPARIQKASATLQSQSPVNKSPAHPAPLWSQNWEGIFGGPGSGSNSWVLSPTRSQTGNAWLANDPHLKLTRPAFWYWTHVDGPDSNVMGASFPGVPFILSGSNETVSWGLTNSFLPASQVIFVSKDELKEAPRTRPLIWVRFWKLQLPFFFKTFQRTEAQLPILPMDDLPENQALVLKWSGFDLKAQDLEGLFTFMNSKTASDMDRALAQIGVPSWNFNFADTKGSIGYRAIGKIARREDHQSFSIPSANLSWVNHHPEFSNPLETDEMPHLLNPSRGFIVTANNHHWPNGFHLRSGRAPATGFRAFRIEELIQATSRHDLKSQQKIQCDLQAVDARFILPLLLKALDQTESRGLWNPQETQALRLLRDWDFQTPQECMACPVYRFWVSTLTHDQGLDTVALYRALRAAPPLISEAALVSAFQTAVGQLTDQGRVGLPQWGAVHINRFPHLAGEESWRTKPISTPGDDHSVNPGTATLTKNQMEHTDGASQRLLVEMSTPPQIFSVLPGMNPDELLSDEPWKNPASPSSPWQDWAHCHLQKRHFPVNWTQIKNITSVSL
ncbi:MAG: penicillin acylase family protein [Bdellovibrionia bacterium]